MMLHPSKKESLKKDKFFFFGLLAAAFASALAILNQDAYSVALIVAAAGFALALPFLVILISAIYFEETTALHVEHLALDTCSLVAVLGSLVGFVALFWHVHWTAGVVSLIAFFLATMVYMTLNRAVTAARKTTDTTQPLQRTNEENEA
jgi:hypothetical protein